ncbi:MAG: iron ABC transporter permease [Candidatus Obscuribacterales bacterium]|nr:iron ABC transporter permease [Candidatus Obscuribacterales bacterium]
MPVKFLLLTLALSAGIALNLCLGEIHLRPDTVWQILFPAADASQIDPGLQNVLWQIRLPRLLAACLVGAGLAVSGYLLQSLSNNSLADPYLTGVSSGAGLAVALAMVSGIDFSFIPLIALAGGFLASILVASMARSSRGFSISRLLLSGVAVSAVCSSLITLLLYAAPTSAPAQGIFYWLAGSVSGRSWQELCPVSLYILCGCLAALLLSKPLRLLSLGATQAASLGLSVSKAQSAILAAAVLLCASAVSLSGLLGFVGLIAPYFARQLFGRDERAHIFAAAGLGALLVLISDLASRLLLPGQDLPLGTLLSLLGGPFFLFLILKQEAERT